MATPKLPARISHELVFDKSWMAELELLLGKRQLSGRFPNFAGRWLPEIDIGIIIHELTFYAGFCGNRQI